MSWLTGLPSFDIIYIVLIFTSLVMTTLENSSFEEGLSNLPFLCLIYFLLELGSAFAADFVDNNHFVYHFFSPIEHGAYCLIFYKVFHAAQTRKIIFYSVPLFTLISLSISLLDGLDHTTSKAFLIRSVLMLFFCTSYFKQMLSEEKFLSPVIPQTFWFCVGVTFHFGGKLFITGLMDSLLAQDIGLARSFYYIGYIFNYLLFLFIVFIACKQIMAHK